MKFNQRQKPKTVFQPLHKVCQSTEKSRQQSRAFSEKKIQYKNIKNFSKKCLTVPVSFVIMSLAFERTTDMREWRNRQTRTFEGRVVIPYGFKSRLSHQDLGYLTKVFFLCLSLAKMRLNP